MSLQSKNSIELYQSLVLHGLRPLPLEIPDRIRVNKERLARNVAADLALAGSAIRPVIRESVRHPGQENSYADSAHPAAMSSTSRPDLDLAHLAADSQTTPSLPRTAEGYSASVRLRAYTTVSKNAVTSVAPASVMGILAHLPSDVETDPARYDWRATEAAITAEHEDSAETSDPRVRRRAEKLAQAKRKRIQSQTKIAEELVRQRAPPAIGSSQIVLPTREVQSSQAMVPESNVFGDLGALTQPERGAFGTRLSGKGLGRMNKGRKRAAGF